MARIYAICIGKKMTNQGTVSTEQRMLNLIIRGFQLCKEVRQYNNKHFRPLRQNTPIQMRQNSVLAGVLARALAGYEGQTLWMLWYCFRVVPLNCRQMS